MNVQTSCWKEGEDGIKLLGEFIFVTHLKVNRLLALHEHFHLAPIEGGALPVLVQGISGGEFGEQTLILDERRVHPALL